MTKDTKVITYTKDVVFHMIPLFTQGHNSFKKGKKKYVLTFSNRTTEIYAVAKMAQNKQGPQYYLGPGKLLHK